MSLVRVATVQRRTIQPQIVGVGTVRPRWMSVVASGADGQVTGFFVEEGQFVVRDTPLSQLKLISTDLEIEEAKAVLEERRKQLEELEAGTRKEEIDEAHARMLSADAIRKNMADKRRRAQRLFDENAIHREDLDDAIERSAAAEHNYQALKAAYDRLVAGPRKEQVEQARARVLSQTEHVAFLEAEKEKRTTRAPFDGYVVQVQTFVGQWLSKGDPVVTMSMLDELDVTVNVDQSDVRHIALGDMAQVHIEGINPSQWQGTIVAVVPRSDWQSGSRAFPVEVRLKNKYFEENGEKRPLLTEGMIARITFRGKPVEATLVPKDALVRTTRGTNIYLLAPDSADNARGTTQFVPVELGQSEADMVQVIPLPGADGKTAELNPGMLVVSEGGERLRPFPEQVQVLPGVAAGSPPNEKAAAATPPGEKSAAEGNAGKPRNNIDAKAVAEKNTPAGATSVKPEAN